VADALSARPEIGPLVQTVAQISGVEAIALGGSRASGVVTEQSDWDFCVYYRGRFETDAIRALAVPGDVFEPGAWGRLLNGGAWLEVNGASVDLLYRDLALVERELKEAEVGRFVVEEAQGYVAGLPSYFLVGEVALARVLHGELPAAQFSPTLRVAASRRWRSNAAFCLWEAAFSARRGDPLVCCGLLAKAALAEAHARLSEAGEWVFNEKRLLERAGLADSEAIVARGVGVSPDELRRSVDAMRAALTLDQTTAERRAGLSSVRVIRERSGR
jgi:predicted nucleotidyltransferase